MRKKKTLLACLFVALFMAAIFVAFSACKKREDGTSYGYGEEGYYYFDGSDSERYMLSLQAGGYMITVDGETSYSGKYSFDEETGKIAFYGDAEFSALMGEGALSLTVEGSGYSFKAYVWFDVTYVDETGKTVATESVLNGQSASDLDVEKDGYWFIGWYEDGTHSAEYPFDTSIAGDTVIYGWFVEKVEGATEYEVVLDYGDGESETVSTQSGAVWSLPVAHGGNAIVGWWVSATNKEGELTYQYFAGCALDSDTTLFAVYGGLLTSVTEDGISWDASRAGANVTVTVCDEKGEKILSDSVSSSSGLFSSSEFSSLSAGTYTVDVSSGSLTETRVYVVGGLPRVSMSSALVVSDGGGRVFSFAPVDGAEGYTVTVSNGERTITEDLGGETFYDFSDWTMTKEGITFVVTAYADGKVSSVSGTFYFRQVLDRITLEISDGEVFWQAVEGAEEYRVTVTDVDGIVVDSFVTTDTSFPIKYYGAGTYDIYVKPEADGYWSEEGKYLGYAKDAIAAPRITNVTDYEVTWTEVVGAEYYVVKINGTEYEVLTGTALAFSESGVPGGEGPYEISVMAVSGDGNDSPYCDPVTATECSFVASVTYSRNTVYWTYDVAAIYYAVSVNGSGSAVEEGNSFEVTLTKSGYNTVAVTAYGKNDEPLGYAEMMIYAYAVTLDPVGATLVNDAAVNGAIYVAKGDEMNLGTVEKEHAGFVGWYTQPDRTEGQSDEYEGKGFPVEDGSTFTGSGSKYLYAYWSYEYIDVTLDAAGGSVTDGNGKTVSSVRIKYNSSSYFLPVPDAAEEEYAFYGWFVADSGERFTTEKGAQFVAFDGFSSLRAEYVEARTYSRTTYNGATVYEVSAGPEIEKISEMTVPDGYHGYGIIINSDAFGKCAYLKILNVPDTVKYIAVTGNGYDSGAFYACGALEEVNVYVTGDEPDSTKEVTYYSEGGILFVKSSDSTADLLYYPHGNTSDTAVIPAYVSNANECDAFGAAVEYGVATLPARVFKDKAFTKIVLPATITHVEAYAFYENTKLTSIVFEDGGSDKIIIDAMAFYNCSGLTDFAFPSGDFDFDPDIFFGCSSLVNVSASGSYYSSDGGVLLSANKSTLVYYPVGRDGDVDIGSLTSSAITTIGGNAFYGNTKITSVIIPASVSYISSEAFSGCVGLTKLVFEGGENSGDLTIAYRAFYGCSELTSVVLPVNLVTLESCAFEGCIKLSYVYFDARKGTTVSDLSFAANALGPTSYIETLELGPSVPAIDFSSIFGGSRLAAVIIDPDNLSFLSDESGAVYNKNGTE
ncbi:MAG: leucine-rich repeat protein, partial [Bacteroidales bacterium]|nr:leucine-rich repeat protein [Bacteroidales bacterium]